MWHVADCGVCVVGKMTQRWFNSTIVLFLPCWDPLVYFKRRREKGRKEGMGEGKREGSGEGREERGGRVGRGRDVAIVIQQIQMYLWYNVRIHTDTAGVQHVHVVLAQPHPNNLFGAL